MPRRCLLTALGLVIVAAAYAQATDPVIAAIRANYQRVRSERASYKTRSVDLWESTEGGVGTAYYAGKRLQLLEVTQYGETGKWLAQYYYRDGQLCFVLNSSCRYNRPFYYDKKAARAGGDTEAFDPKKTVVEETRYYFQNGRLIRWLDPAGKPQPVAAAAKDESYQELLTNEAHVRAELSK